MGTGSTSTYDVTSYGAKGDGETDDSNDSPSLDLENLMAKVPSGGRELMGPVCNCPSMLRFHACNGLRLRGTKHINSPNSHIHINGCQDVQIGHLRISAPANSPNTDGIDISSSSHVIIHDSTIQTGDDCVAINGGTYDINVRTWSWHKPTAGAVHVSNVTYTNIYGSSATKQAITFDCSEMVKCTGIRTNRVHITGEEVVTYCANAKGNFIKTTPHITCN
ncbi:polygalacturonase-2-like [Cynara cardunculus var. scolymus]|uniref:polygalacturonase-2-like n=1 Tax=Cynara cardunculus var. scolymus TaxID=59895 RepID=UPI000D62A09F|nr:polygalacturonase-2-like [Cynara cardunculus var. scolymus]